MTLSWRKLLFGDPYPTHHAQHTRLPNVLALPVFASDALSSVAYATEEILLVLALVGTSQAVLGFSWPIALAIAILLGIVATSYRQTIHAYPQGGGAYRVSRENLGIIPGLTAAASLLIDYVLTVAVSISAGVAAITSAIPALHNYAVWLAVGFILFIAMANLRGAKESGVLFAVPTYLFIASIAVLILAGLARMAMGQQMVPPPPPAEHLKETTHHLGLFLILRAFSSGCTALTGIEAVTDGVPAFRPPEAKNAAKVLGVLGVILIAMFMGITFLAWRLNVVPFPADMEGPGIHRQTVISQIAYAVFGPSWFYYLIQAATAMILILAANTAYVDFPRLCMFLSQDRMLPRQFANVGDRLVYSNGILVVTLLSIITVVAFGASTHHLIPLYALGVFLSFTLSQSGMVIRWCKMRPAGWVGKALVNAIGAAATCLVLVIIAITKFMAGDPVQFFPLTTPVGFWMVLTLGSFLMLTIYKLWMGRMLLAASVVAFPVAWLIFRFDPLAHLEIHLGAWLVMVAIPMLVWMFFRINAHYGEVAEHLTMDRYADPGEIKNTVLLVVGGVHRGLMPAVKYARSLSSDVRAVYVEIEPTKTPQVMERWSQWVPDIPLVLLESPYRALVDPLCRYIDEVENERDDDVVTVIIPEFVTEKWWTKLLHGQNGMLLKWALLFKPRVVVTNIRYNLTRALEEEKMHPLSSHLHDGQKLAGP